MTDNNTARRFSPDNGTTWHTADDLPDEYWLAGHWDQIEELMEDRAPQGHRGLRRHGGL